MARTRAKRPKVPEQGYLDPELEPVKIKEIDTAAEAYADARDERMKLSEEETEAQNTLGAVMEKHNLEAYEYDGNRVTVDRSMKVKVKKLKAKGRAR